VSGVAGKAIKGTLLSVGTQFASQLMRLVSQIVTACYLAPSEFGVNGFLVVVTTGLWLVSDVGIGASVVRSARDDDDFVDTAWTLSMVRGIALFVLGSIAGPIAAHVYDEPRLTWLLPFSSLMILFLSAESIQLYTLQRQMEITRVLGIDLVSQAAGLAISIPLAMKTGSVWSLAASAVGSGFVRFLLSHTMLGGRRPRWRWEKAALNEIFSFGQWIFLSTLLSFLAMRWDGISLPKLQGFALFGIYNVASIVTSVPREIANQVTSMVLTPVLAAAFRASPDELRRRLSSSRSAYLPAAMLLFLGAATTAPAFFLIAYKNPEFHAAGPMAQILLLPMWFAFLQEASSRAMVADGDGRGLAVTNGIKVAVTILSTLVGFNLGGFQGFIAGTMLGAFTGVVVVAVRLGQRGLPVLSGEIGATVVVVGLGVVACGGPLLLAPVVGIHAAWLTLGSCALVCGPLALVVVKRVKAVRAEAAGWSIDEPAATAAAPTTTSTMTTATTTTTDGDQRDVK
jgi:O-antigen/teichoic acid export membrane protein